MENRKQFTMYESIYKSLQRIRNKKDRADAYDAICAYALYNQEPNLETASDAVAIAFELTRPVLDSARKKSESGKQGGSKTKQDGSKPKAKGKQTTREKENEEEKEVEGEKENEEEIEKESLFLSAGGESAHARAATDKELLSIGVKPGEYCGVTSERVEWVLSATEALFDKYRHCRPEPWDCRKVFQYCAAAENLCLLEYAFETAAVAGKAGDWRYIDGIMNRLSVRGIHTPEEAREWDEARPDMGDAEPADIQRVLMEGET